MGKVVEDFEGEKVAGRWNVSVPVKDGAVDDLYMVSVAARRGRAVELRGLQRGKGRGDLDDFELCSFVHIRKEVPNVVEDI